MQKTTQIKITQIKSAIGQTQRQKKTIKALGLKKINHTVAHQATPAIQGMLKKINHLITVEKI